ncbi:hypothetical protein KDA_23530 [Dictyobacter alpinus]|uniref:Uncharacterized protein n=1 Tax=Dictyobacter alpinus TaxID=2014873 RepID=A0A402B6A5_9CHLR|nr:hypothetical protein [Dictyobacter alpinus]GCE26869.1 hypothetical protein KDA_23530 [Dictyobacter alpinus]
MTPAELERAHQSIEQKWYELVQAEQQGASVQDLERKYEKYLRAVDDYNRRSAAYQDKPRKRRFPGVA